jgi:cytochrome c-type biogenesis protein CcmH
MLRILILSLLLLSTPSQAGIEAYDFPSAQIEADFNKLINEIRCLVCQNQNIASSNAELAKDLRQQTYKMLVQGDTPDQVLEYMVARYGEFILYRPRLKNNTLLLWFGPFGLLIFVLLLVFRKVRRNQKLVSPDVDAMQRAQQLLSNNQEKV